MELFRVKAWTTTAPKLRKGEPRRAGVVSAGYKAPVGKHVVMLGVTTVDEHEGISDAEIIRAIVQDHGLVPSDDEIRADWERAIRELSKDGAA